MKIYLKRIKTNTSCCKGLLQCTFKPSDNLGCLYASSACCGYIFVPATKQEIAEYYEKKEAKK